MAHLTIRDDALWAKHIADPAMRSRVVELPAGASLRLLVDGHPIVFRKMADGRDGRPTPGLRADPDDGAGRAAWSMLQHRRGESVTIVPADPSGTDPYLAYLDTFFHEWNSPEDAAAFDGL